MSYVADGVRLLSLSKLDFMQLQDISSRIKAMDELVCELMRGAMAGSLTEQSLQRTSSLSEQDRLFDCLRIQIEDTQGTLNEYLLSLPGAASHPALSDIFRAMTISNSRLMDSRTTYPDIPGRGRSRSRSSTQGSQDSASYRMHRSPSSFVTQAQPDPSTPPHYGSATMPAIPKFSNVESKSKYNDKKMRLPIPDIMNPRKALDGAISTRAMSVSSAIEQTIARTWRDPQIKYAAAKPIDEVFACLGGRYVSPLGERMPHIPVRELSVTTGAPVSAVDLANDLLRSSLDESEASIFIKQIEALPPGIVACAITNSTSQLFQQLTKESIIQYASSGMPSQSPGSAPNSLSAEQPILRMLSDHANFLSRLMETSIIYPMQASQRAKRIEWWTVVICLIRELGDYESLNSLVCVFSSATILRLHNTWELVPASCSAAIQFITNNALKAHPNYANYRKEMQLRIKRLQKNTKAASGNTNLAYISSIINQMHAEADEASLDFDSAIAISTPDLCSSNDEYERSCVYCKEGFDLPSPRALVPIVAVLLKDAVTAGVASASTSPVQANSANRPGVAQWATVFGSCSNQRLPISLDPPMIRRIFATELSSLPSLNVPITQGAVSRSKTTTANILKRMPRRQSNLSDNSVRELSGSHCRFFVNKSVSPTIFDMLAHFLFVACNKPCFNCHIGLPLDSLHMSSSGQFAVLVTALLIFSEPWMPSVHLSRLSDIREPRQPVQSYALKSPGQTSMGAASTQSGVTARHPLGSPSQGYESRSNERPSITAFKIEDSADSGRYSKSKHGIPLPIDLAQKRSSDSEYAYVYYSHSPITSPYSYVEFVSGADQSQSSRTSSEMTAANSLTDSSNRLLESANNGQIQVGGGYTMEAQHHQGSFNPPPLPSSEMPTWLPASHSVARSQKILLKSLRNDVPPVPVTPPLQARHMPRLYPNRGDAHNTSQMPLPLPTANIPPLPNSTASTLAGHTQPISADARMLLGFDAMPKSR
ncbi:hypothetical protein LPJ66_006646 [Kickxella alabastrina]|uniref:Uncharacterized protein n=1 Tax=Kickxella alabastrina TaxID=61397 RepID=A0ACC1ICJ7_9FUNG|nr:hypothetical protein LPJ66_006646 [Kickxella alabastrina]